MYESFLRPPDDPWFTPDRVDWHYGTRHDFVTWVKSTVIDAVQKGRPAIEALGPRLIKWIIDARLLREAWDLLAKKGETAPGPNEHRYDDYDSSEVWAKLTAIGAAIHKDTYRPGGERKVEIPKDRTDPDRGTRTLTLIDIEDRVVQRAVIEVLQPLFDSLFGRNILGFRPRHGRLHAVALAEQQAVAEGRYVLVTEDLADAFDHVPINRLLDVLALYIPSHEVLQLLRRLLDTERGDGIRQGGPLSPILLNVYLHHFLDEPWRQNWASIPMIRVADDILLLCRTKKQAEQAQVGLRELLTPAAMPLKIPKEATVHDLRKGEAATWLGFMIGMGQEGFTVTLAERAWKRLNEYLMLAHEKPDAAVRAAATIKGWIDQTGPCYPFMERQSVYERLAELAAAQAFEEIPSGSAMTSRWRRAYERWCDLRKEIKERPEVLDSAWRKNEVKAAAAVLQVEGVDQHGDKAGDTTVSAEAHDESTAPW